MKHFAAYARLVLSGNAAPSAADVEKVLNAAGLKGDDGKNAALVEAMAGKSFHEVVASGLGKMASAAPAAGASAGSAAPAKAEAKKEVKKEEPEEDLDMGDLFGY